MYKKVIIKSITKTNKELKIKRGNLPPSRSFREPEVGLEKCLHDPLRGGTILCRSSGKGK